MNEKTGEKNLRQDAGTTHPDDLESELGENQNSLTGLLRRGTDDRDCFREHGLVTELSVEIHTAQEESLRRMRVDPAQRNHIQSRGREQMGAFYEQNNLWERMIQSDKVLYRDCSPINSSSFRVVQL